MKKLKWWGILALAIGAIAFLIGDVWRATPQEEAAPRTAVKAQAPEKKAKVAPPAPVARAPEAAEGEEAEADDDKDAAAAEEAEEKLVNAFDDETDRWMNAEETKPPTMAEVEKFRTMFKAVPKERKEECLRRALNLVPDENVMLLAGILMDKTEDAELVELVYNDILNRDEGVKKPILETIFKDKTHPCWVDTAWILDVTGELPEKK